jgi:molybdate transport system regulatory protein
MRCRIRARVKVWIESNGSYAIGDGLAGELAAVRQKGSMVEAAKHVGQSYRYFWGKIRRAEKALGRKLVVSEVGGTGHRRSGLTPFGDALLGFYLKVRTDLERRAARRSGDISTLGR